MKQINCLFPDNEKISLVQFDKVFDIALDRTEYCFKHVNLKSYCDNGRIFLNHLHADQYAVFIWFLSNTVWVETRDENMANKLYYLNRALHGLSCSYEAKLPSIFLLVHIVGTVLGKAEYSDFFVALHGCTVGAHHGIYPRIGRGVAMLPHSSIIGDCTVGDRVSLGINTTLYEKNVSNNMAVYTDLNTGQVCYKQNRMPWAQQFFNVQI